MLHDILGNDHIQWHPQLIRHYTNLWTNYQTGPYYRLWRYYQISGGFHRTLQRMRLANRGRLLLRTPGPVPFWTCICSNVETIFSWTCRVLGPWISNIPCYFYFASNMVGRYTLISIWSLLLFRSVCQRWSSKVKYFLRIDWKRGISVWQILFGILHVYQYTSLLVLGHEANRIRQREQVLSRYGMYGSSIIW